MPKYRLYATVTGGKYLGEVEAANEKEAIKKGWKLETVYASVCHRCSHQISDPEVTKITAELDEEDQDDGDTSGQSE